jgi:hypothetical protein
MTDHTSDTGAHRGVATQGNDIGYAPRAGATAVNVTPTDRVRWGPIIAGLFTALSALALLGVLGLAIGFSSYDANDRLRNFGIGAGVWGAVSALLAFFIGGMIAARTAAVAGRNNGALQGAMVWVVAIPLLLWTVSSMIGATARTAGAAADRAADLSLRTAEVGAESAQAAAEANPDQAQQAAARIPSADQAKEAASSAADQARQRVQQVATPENVERASEQAAKGAWGTLISMVLGLAAATVGGLLGARDPSHRRHTAAA